MQLVLERRAERSTLIAVASPLIAVALTIGTFAILFAIMGKNPCWRSGQLKASNQECAGAVCIKRICTARYHPVRMICAHPSASFAVGLVELHA